MIDYEKTYGRKERGQIFPHLPLRTQRSYFDADLVESAIEGHDGRGLKRGVKIEHLYQLALVEELNGLNLPHSVIREIMKDRFFGLVDMDPNDRPDPAYRFLTGDKLPRILNNMSNFLIIFHGEGYNPEKGYAQEDVWKATLVPSGELPDFLRRFSNPLKDDALIHAIKFRLHDHPATTILIDLGSIWERLLEYMKKAGISPFKQTY